MHGAGAGVHQLRPGMPVQRMKKNRLPRLVKKMVCSVGPDESRIHRDSGLRVVLTRLEGVTHCESEPARRLCDSCSWTVVTMASSHPPCLDVTGSHRGAHPIL